MAKISGINVCGYSEGTGTDVAGMQTCGQVEIGGFSDWTGGDPQEFLDALYAKARHGGALNVVFSITGAHFITPNNNANKLIDYLLAHPNTRVMHWYKNDAHGPNWIFLCIYHRQLPSMKTSPGYTVDDIRKRITYKLGEYNMKEGPECS